MLQSWARVASTSRTTTQKPLRQHCSGPPVNLRQPVNPTATAPLTKEPTHRKKLRQQTQPVSNRLDGVKQLSPQHQLQHPLHHHPLKGNLRHHHPLKGNLRSRAVLVALREPSISAGVQLTTMLQAWELAGLIHLEEKFQQHSSNTVAHCSIGMKSTSVAKHCRTAPTHSMLSKRFSQKSPRSVALCVGCEKPGHHCCEWDQAASMTMHQLLFATDASAF